jgi:hypothetical protein
MVRLKPAHILSSWARIALTFSAVACSGARLQAEDSARTRTSEEGTHCIGGFRVQKKVPTQLAKEFTVLGL